MSESSLRRKLSIWDFHCVPLKVPQINSNAPAQLEAAMGQSVHCHFHKKKERPQQERGQETLSAISSGYFQVCNKHETQYLQ